MNRVEFLNPTSLSGTFTTVQPGEAFRKLNPQEEVALVGPDGTSYGYAKAIDIWVGDLAQIPASLLEMEQNPLHRTFSGLSLGLRAFQPEGVTPFDRVSALVLEFTRSSLLH